MTALSYAWPPSVADGESFAVHASSPRGTVDVEVARIGAQRQVVFRAAGVVVGDHDVPTDAVARGCDWPVALTVPVDGWPSGYYEVVVRGDGDPPDPAATSAFVVVRPAPSS